MKPPADTTPEAEAFQVERLRSMSAAEKLRLAMAMSQTVRDLAIAGIRRRHPRASDREVLLRLAVVQYGRELAAAAYPDINALDLP